MGSKDDYGESQIRQAAKNIFGDRIKEQPKAQTIAQAESGKKK